MAIANGSFGLAVLRHSKNPSAGIRQRRLESCVGLAADYLYRGTSTWSRGEAYELHLCDCVKRGALFGKQAHCISVFYCVTGNEPSPDILTQLLEGTVRPARFRSFQAVSRERSRLISRARSEKHCCKCKKHPVALWKSVRYFYKLRNHQEPSQRK